MDVAGGCIERLASRIAFAVFCLQSARSTVRLTNSAKQTSESMLRTLSRPFGVLARSFHSSVPLRANLNEYGLPICKNWTQKNEKMHSPEKPVTPYVYHARTQVHCGRKKLLPLMWKIRGLSIDEAIAQMQFTEKKVAKDVIEALRDARKEAMLAHNIEFPSNMWVAEAMVTKGIYHDGLRRHGRGRGGEILYRYSHILICLHEGKPPKHYYPPDLTPEQKLQQFKRELDRRYVMYSI